ncbi:hypothetical protein BDW74DRAFT_7606 [Aspergillus multicolor]|uniref:uncharacterized protein n=1 Tax=Aspergillus multicolor TaxID=41759 RepID=UPI003CCCBDB4
MISRISRQSLNSKPGELGPERPQSLVTLSQSLASCTMRPDIGVFVLGILRMR